MKIDQKWIDKYHPCGWNTGLESVQWWKENGSKSDPFEILNDLIKNNNLNWANWFLVRLMNRKQHIRYAIYAAEQVLGIYENRYPDDKRPRLAIEAAKRCLKNPTKKNKDFADAAADAATDAATNAATHAADAAANAAANAANAAYADYVTANAAYAADHNMKLKIIRYGIKILKK